MENEHKSERLKNVAINHGWKAQVVPKLDKYEKTGDPATIEWHVYAIRDKETIHVYYLGNRFISSTYSYGSVKLYPARSGGVVRLLAGKPDPRKLEGDAESLLESRSVPWDDETPALDILLAVLGKNISWVRKIDGEVCTAHLDKGTNLGKTYFRVKQTSSGRRILEWQNREGFHAVGLDQIIGIG